MSSTEKGAEKPDISLSKTLFQFSGVEKTPQHSLSLDEQDRIEKEDYEKAFASGMRAYRKGDKIDGRYEVLAFVRGGMGMVYLCFDREENTLVAIKTVLPQYFRNQQALENFRQEARTWVHLEKHENIVRAMYVSNVDEQPAVFLQLIIGAEGYGSNLKGYIERYPFTFEEALKVAVQCCDGMMHAEQKFKEMGKVFVHRDIKPSNIMMTNEMVPKITDFGLAKSEEADKRWGGTYGYMSPEQYRGEDIDSRADIYSFGCILYELFCGGRKPHELTEGERSSIGTDKVSAFVQQKHVEEPLEGPFPLTFHGSGSQRLNRILSQCLEKDRGKRFTDFRTLREELHGLYQDLTGQEIVPAQGEELSVRDLHEKGWSLVVLGKYDEALECTDRLLAEDPDSDTSWVAKGLAFLGAKRYDDAILHFDKALEINGDNANAWTAKAFSLRRKNRLEESLACYDHALSIKPNNVSALEQKARVLSLLGRLEEALTCFDTIVLQLDLKDNESWEKKGTILMQLNRVHEAVHCFDTALEIRPASTWAWVAKGFAYSILNRPKEAIRCYDTALEINPGDHGAWAGKGTAFDVGGNLDEALKCYDKALALDPKLAEVWHNKGRVLNRLRKRREALQCFDAALEIRREYPEALAAKGELLSDLEEYEESIACYDQALKLKPDLENGWIQKARALEALGRTKEAQACRARSLSKEPGSCEAWIAKGDGLVNTGSYQEAIECYDKAIAMDPGCARAWHNKGCTLDRSGRFAEAVACLTEALKLSPNDANAWHNKGTNLLKLGRIDEALECANRVLELEPDHGHAWYFRGLALLKSGNAEQGLHGLKKAAALEVKEADMLLKQLGRR